MYKQKLHWGWDVCGALIHSTHGCDIAVWDDGDPYSGVELIKWPGGDNDGHIIFDIIGHNFRDVIIECIEKIYDDFSETFKKTIQACDDTVALDIDDLLNQFMGGNMDV